MELNVFLDQLFEKAKEAGLEAAEAYIAEDESFHAMATDGEITQYSSNLTKGLSLRVKVNGKIGYASTEAFDEDAIGWLLENAIDSAVLCEDTSEQFIYDGKEKNAALNLEGDIGDPADKLQFVLDSETAAKGTDARIYKVGYNTIISSKESVRIVNTYGMDKKFTATYGIAYLMPLAKDGESNTSGIAIQIGRGFSALNANKLGREAAEDAISMLHASTVTSGQYRVVLRPRAMADMLSVFSSTFSAEIVHKGLSAYKGKLGETVAAECITLMDDSLLAQGIASRPFDAEGVPGGSHALIENGVLKTFLHNLKTAKKDGVKSTGNASKAGYAAPIQIAPTNFYIKPGTTDYADMLSAMGDGLVITEVSGLHAGADAVSGDFSLLSKGFLVKGGKVERPVEQITIAGNFYQMLKEIRTVGSDLAFPEGAVGSPSIDVGKLSVAGN